jgi:hypothetical protein
MIAAPCVKGCKTLAIHPNLSLRDLHSLKERIRSGATQVQSGKLETAASRFRAS